MCPIRQRAGKEFEIGRAKKLGHHDLGAELAFGRHVGAVGFSHPVLFGLFGTQFGGGRHFAIIGEDDARRAGIRSMLIIGTAIAQNQPAVLTHLNIIYCCPIVLIGVTPAMRRVGHLRGNHAPL